MCVLRLLLFVLGIMCCSYSQCLQHLQYVFSTANTTVPVRSYSQPVSFGRQYCNALCTRAAVRNILDNQEYTRQYLIPGAWYQVCCNTLSIRSTQCTRYSEHTWSLYQHTQSLKYTGSIVCSLQQGNIVINSKIGGQHVVQHHVSNGDTSRTSSSLHQPAHCILYCCNADENTWHSDSNTLRKERLP